MELTIKCECGNEKKFNLIKDDDVTIANGYLVEKLIDRFDISKHHEDCDTMGGIECLICGRYVYI